MKLLLITYSFHPHGTSGADVYHYELAKQLVNAGQSVVVCTRTCSEPYFTDGIEVHPLRFKDSFCQQADAVITVPSISALITHHNITAIQHTVVPVGSPNPDCKFVYCAEHLQGMYKGRSMVYRPTMRLMEAKEPRTLTREPVIGFINNAVQKGGALIGPVAKAGYQVRVKYWPGMGGEFFKPDMPNIEYDLWEMDRMDKFYDAIDIMVLGSYSEGYSTVALECLAKGIPVVARDIAGLREPLGSAGIYFEDSPISGIEYILPMYEYMSMGILNRWQVVKKLNDLDALIKFITND